MGWTLDQFVRRNALRYPHKPGFVMGDSVRTWQEVDQRVDRVANALRAAGQGSQNRVAILLRNCLEYPEVLFGASRAGLIALPLSYRLTVPELREIVATAEPGVIVAAEEDAHKAAELMSLVPSLQQVWVVGGDEAGARAGGESCYEAVLAAASADPAVSPAREDDPFAIFYTSGTTGNPKGAMVTHLNLEANGYNQGLIDHSRSADVNLVGTPLYHMGAVRMMITYLMLGCTQVINHRFDPALWLETVQRRAVTVAVLVSTMINSIVNHPGLAAYDLSSLRTIFYGGGPTPPAVLKRAMQTLRCGFTQSYGMTETLEATFLLPGDHVLDGTPQQTKRLASAGREAVGADIRIIDDQGFELASGQVGEILIRSRSVIPGYWKSPEATAQAIKDGWFYTGDLGYLDEDRYLFIVDRKKDVVLSGGVNIFTKEIEAVLYTHPSVMEAAVVGLPDDHWGEVVTACVVLRPGTAATEQDLVSHCLLSLASYKKPRRVYFLEDLPKSPSGKVLKRELRTHLTA